MRRNTTLITSFCAGALLLAAFHSEAAEQVKWKNLRIRDLGE